MKVFAILAFAFAVFGAVLAEFNAYQEAPEGPSVLAGKGENMYGDDIFCGCRWVPDYWLRDACMTPEEAYRFYTTMKVSLGMWIMYYIDPCDSWFGPYVFDWAVFYQFGICPDDIIEAYPWLGYYRSQALCCSGCQGLNELLEIVGYFMDFDDWCYDTWLNPDSQGIFPWEYVLPCGESMAFWDQPVARLSAQSAGPAGLDKEAAKQNVMQQKQQAASTGYGARSGTQQKQKSAGKSSARSKSSSKSGAKSSTRGHVGMLSKDKGAKKEKKGKGKGKSEKKKDDNKGDLFGGKSMTKEHIAMLFGQEVAEDYDPNYNPEAEPATLSTEEYDGIASVFKAQRLSGEPAPVTGPAALAAKSRQASKQHSKGKARSAKGAKSASHAKSARGPQQRARKASRLEAPAVPVASAPIAQGAAAPGPSVRRRASRLEAPAPVAQAPIESAGPVRRSRYRRDATETAAVPSGTAKTEQKQARKAVKKQQKATEAKVAQEAKLEAATEEAPAAAPEAPAASAPAPAASAPALAAPAPAAPAPSVLAAPEASAPAPEAPAASAPAPAPEAPAATEQKSVLETIVASI